MKIYFIYNMEGIRLLSNADFFICKYVLNSVILCLRGCDVNIILGDLECYICVTVGSQ